MKLLILTLLFVSLLGCAHSGYKQFYKPYVDTKTLTDIELLKEGQKPEVLSTDDFDRDIAILRSKKYISIGQSSFNGRYEDTRNAAAQAKRIGATLVLVSSQYTNTQTTTSTLLLPDNKTTYQSGTASAGTSYNSASGGYLGSSNTNTTYRGTATTYGTKAVPITSHQRRYDQSAVYFVKSTKKLKIGITYSDLTLEQRAQIERNTGIFIHSVIEDSPAFFSNVLVGDVLIALDGKLVKNEKHFGQILDSMNPEKTSHKLTLIRNGSERIIEIHSQ